MAITISDGTNSVTIKPYRVAVTSSYAVKFGLGYAVAVYATPESVLYNMSTLVSLSDLQTLLSLNTEVTVTNDDTTAIPEIPSSAACLLNRIEIRGESKTHQNVREVDIKLVKKPG